jgi:hypothetical protein
MQGTKLNFGRFHWASFSKLAAIAILLAGYFPTRSMAQESGQKTFSSAQEATAALVAAAQSNDEKALLDILGPDAKQIVSSGDETEDAQNRTNFVQRYQEMHRLVKEPDGTTVNKGNLWYFDMAAGKREILYRRVGRNEISTIHVCQQLVAAEKEYYSAHNNEYAQKFLSDEGQQNGLYWKGADSQPQSPIGPLVAEAVAEGYTATHDGAPPTPYRGYYYRMLTRQGASAPGGAKKLHRQRQNDRGLRFRGLSSGIQVVRRDDLHRGQGWSTVSQRPRPEYSDSR